MCVGQDSVSWLLGTPKQSLGFILADGGFDVWFANTRGTNSSRNHTSLSPNDPVFLSSLVKNAFHWIFTNSVLINIFRPTGIGRGTSLLPMIFLLSFSISMITQEVRKSTILVTPW
jgi:lysosomal acid lipase/cholesteryl ester hydrolase